MIPEENKLEYELLKEMNKSKAPIGASLLALEINVPQATIGRKLQELEYKGYLVKLSNKGRVLTEKGNEYYKDLERSFYGAKNVEKLINEVNDFNKKRLLDVLQTREILEKETAKLAAEKITEEQIEELENILNRQKDKISKGMLGDEEDLKLHQKIASIAGNQVIEQVLTLVLSQKGIYSILSYIRKNLTTSIVDDHNNLINALKARDKVKASTLMVNHINNISKDVESYYKEKDKKGKGGIE